MRRDFIWAALFAALGITIAIAGQPRPLAIIAGGCAGLTGAYIAARALDRP